MHFLVPRWMYCLYFWALVLCISPDGNKISALTVIRSGNMFGCVGLYLGHVLCIEEEALHLLHQNMIYLPGEAGVNSSFQSVTCGYTRVGGAAAFTTDETTWFLLSGSPSQLLHWRCSSFASGHEITTSCWHPCSASERRCPCVCVCACARARVHIPWHEDLCPYLMWNRLLCVGFSRRSTLVSSAEETKQEHWAIT